MINPRSNLATTKCRDGCFPYSLCAPCRNFRKLFKIGKCITWGVCAKAYKIIRVSDKGPVIENDIGAQRVVSFTETNLKFTDKEGYNFN